MREGRGVVVITVRNGSAIDRKEFTKGNWWAAAWEYVKKMRSDYPDADSRVEPLEAKEEK